VSISSNITEGPSAPPPWAPTMTEFKAGPRRRKPTHPGTIIARDLEALNMSVNACAIAIGVTRAGLGKLIAEKSAISPEMALRLAKFFRTTPELLMHMQVDYDLWEANQEIKDQLAKIKPAEWDREEIEDD
jgi:addiction module HigA family antidote